MEGERTEDHLAAIVFNAMVLMDLEVRVRAGKLPKSLVTLNDYPWWKDAGYVVRPEEEEWAEEDAEDEQAERAA
jgi:hypothetical protein